MLLGCVLTPSHSNSWLPFLCLCVLFIPNRSMILFRSCPDLVLLCTMHIFIRGNLVLVLVWPFQESFCRIWVYSDRVSILTCLLFIVRYDNPYFQYLLRTYRSEWLILDGFPQPDPVVLVTGKILSVCETYECIGDATANWYWLKICSWHLTVFPLGALSLCLPLSPPSLTTELVTVTLTQPEIAFISEDDGGETKVCVTSSTLSPM